ncbi:MAG: NAD(P)-dependent oxidoreductase [Actinobacteria bacterium]|nr:NAD(P)-dependent oxidoreductase [Actinomycetota bacterium]
MTDSASPLSGLGAIGIIGVGRMGAGMWRCLRAAGTTARVFDAHAPATDALAADGAPVAPSAHELLAGADVVLVSLPTSPDVQTVIGDALDALRPATVVIDTTSGEPAVSRAIAATVQSASSAYLDAGISGGPPGALAGTLKIMVGGDEAAFSRVQPLLDVLGAQVWHCGGPGTGHAMKTALNLSNQGKMLLEIEALLLCGRAGLDPRQVAEVLELRTWSHFLLGDDGRRPFGFAVDLAVKDWGVATGVATEHKVPMPIAAACAQVMRAARAEAGSDADLIDVVRVMERWAEYDLDAGLGR